MKTHGSFSGTVINNVYYERETTTLLRAMKTRKVFTVCHWQKRVFMKMIWGSPGGLAASREHLYLLPVSLTVFGMQNNLAPSSSVLSHGTTTASTGW